MSQFQRDLRRTKADEADAAPAEAPEREPGFREGCPAVLERVYHCYADETARYLRSLAYRLSAPEYAQPSLVADLLQEVFMRAFSRSALARCDVSNGLGGYLKVIARHCLIDALRKHRREVLMAPHDLSADLQAAVDPWEISISCDPYVAAIVSAYLDELPKALRLVYEQRFVLGRSQEEAGLVLRASRRQVRTLERHLRVGLRRALGDRPRPGR